MRIIIIISAILVIPVSGVFAQTDAFKVPDWLEFVEEIRIPNDQFSGRLSNLSIDQAGNVLFNAEFNAISVQSTAQSVD
jgi:maltodextrin utilization protein YvdJ